MVGVTKAFSGRERLSGTIGDAEMDGDEDIGRENGRWANRRHVLLVLMMMVMVVVMMTMIIMEMMFVSFSSQGGGCFRRLEGLEDREVGQER